jgi:hypothetical protein
MPKLTGIEGIIGSTSQPQPGGKPSIHQPNPPTGNTINHGLTIHSLCVRQFGLTRAANVTRAGRHHTNHDDRRDSTIRDQGTTYSPRHDRNGVGRIGRKLSVNHGGRARPLRLPSVHTKPRASRRAVGSIKSPKRRTSTSSPAKPVGRHRRRGHQLSQADFGVVWWRAQRRPRRSATALRMLAALGTPLARRRHAPSMPDRTASVRAHGPG